MQTAGQYEVMPMNAFFIAGAARFGDLRRPNTEQTKRAKK
jgi:hypothetical protein